MAEFPAGPAERRSQRSVDQLIMELAAAQHGIVTRSQLLRRGVAAHLIERRVESGRLRRLYRGVYRVAGPIEAPYMGEAAAVLACGDAAAVSHRSAAVLRQLLPRRGAKDGIDVVVWRGRPNPGRGLRVHHIRPPQPDEVALWEGIPVTTAARTIFDLAAVVAQRELEQVVATALDQRICSLPDIVAVAGRYGKRPGTKRLRALLGAAADDGPTASPAERRFRELVRRARIRTPQSNTSVEGHRVDFVWPSERLIAEVDGFAYHSSPGMFESDRLRDAELLAAGWRVFRVTWSQMLREPEAMLVRLALALNSAGSRSQETSPERTHPNDTFRPAKPGVVVPS